MKMKGKKFEIAAYKNKAVSWRAGTEKDLSEVLQTVKVYTNVSKGDLARKEDLVKYFDEEDEEKVCITILNKGELQLGEKEREIMYESLYRDIVTIVCNLCINPDTQRPYPPGIIDRALKEMHFSVKPGKSAKKQALEIIRKLKKVIPIDRAQMRLEIFITNSALSRKVKAMLKNGESNIEKDVFNPDDKSVSLTVLIDPGMFREIDEFANEHGGECMVNVLDTTVLREGEEKIDDILSEDEEEEQEEEVAKDERAEAEEEHKKNRKDKKQTSSSTTTTSKQVKKKKKNTRGKRGGGKYDDSDDESTPSVPVVATADNSDDEEEFASTMKKKPANNRRKKKNNSHLD